MFQHLAEAVAVEMWVVRPGAVVVAAAAAAAVAVVAAAAVGGVAFAKADAQRLWTSAVPRVAQGIENRR